jgi:hypothetical protein
MQRLAKTSLAAALLVAVTTSASAVEVWQGHLFITAANRACNAGNWRVNVFFNAVYLPAGVSDNGPTTFLALFHSRNAMSFAVNGALSGAGGYNAGRIRPTGPTQSWSGSFSKARVTPASPSDTTPTVTVRVQLNPFGNVPNCTAMLQGSLGKRPDL